MTGSIAKAYTAIGGLHCNCLNSHWTALTITPTTSWPGRISVLRRFRKIKQILPCVWIELWQIKKLWKLIQIWQKPIIWSVSCRLNQIWPQATKKPLLKDLPGHQLRLARQDQGRRFKILAWERGWARNPWRHIMQNVLALIYHPHFTTWVLVCVKGTNSLCAVPRHGQEYCHIVLFCMVLRSIAWYCVTYFTQYRGPLIL